MKSTNGADVAQVPAGAGAAIELRPGNCDGASWCRCPVRTPHYGYRAGWVYGANVGTDRAGIEWLTVPGNGYIRPRLADKPAGAEPTHEGAVILARVAEIPYPNVAGPHRMAYRVIERGAAVNHSRG